MKPIRIKLIIHGDGGDEASRVDFKRIRKQIESMDRGQLASLILNAVDRHAKATEPTIGFRV